MCITIQETGSGERKRCFTLFASLSCWAWLRALGCLLSSDHHWVSLVIYLSWLVAAFSLFSHRVMGIVLVLVVEGEI